MNCLDKSAKMIANSTEIDDMDKMIINELIYNSRISYSDLAEKVHLSRVSVRERVLKLKESGVIKNFTVFVDSAMVGLKTSVFFDIKAAPGKIHDVAKKIA